MRKEYDAEEMALKIARFARIVSDARKSGGHVTVGSTHLFVSEEGESIVHGAIWSMDAQGQAPRTKAAKRFVMRHGKSITPNLFAQMIIGMILYAQDELTLRALSSMSLVDELIKGRAAVPTVELDLEAFRHLAQSWRSRSTPPESNPHVCGQVLSAGVSLLRQIGLDDFLPRRPFGDSGAEALCVPFSVVMTCAPIAGNQKGSEMMLGKYMTIDDDAIMAAIKHEPHNYASEFIDFGCGEEPCLLVR